MEVVSENKFKNTTKVYYGVVKQVNDKKCTISINGKNFVLPVYGGVVFVNKTYAAIIPQNNINQACVLGESTLQSLVDTVTIPTAKEIMGINDAGMNFMVSKLTSTNQLGTLNWTVQNTAAPDYLNHRVGFIGQTDRMYLYDYTDKKAIWYIPTDFITNAILNSSTSYSTRIDAANAIWNSMDDAKQKIGRVLINSTIYGYWALKNSANYSFVILTTYSGGRIYRVVKTNGSVSAYTYNGTDDTFGTNNTQSITLSIANGATETISIQNSETGFLALCSASQSAKDFVSYNCTSTGVVSFVQIRSATGVSISSDTNELTITNSSGSNVYVMKFFRV